MSDETWFDTALRVSDEMIAESEKTEPRYFVCEFDDHWSIGEGGVSNDFIK